MEEEATEVAVVMEAVAMAAEAVAMEEEAMEEEAMEEEAVVVLALEPTLQTLTSPSKN